MEKKQIILVRHGESITNKKRLLTGRTDTELTRLGEKQAKRASDFIKKRYSPIDIIFTSPLKRAYGTALLISKKVKAPVQEESLLLETDFGNWEGLDKNALQSKPDWEAYVQDPFHFQFPEGESPQDVKKRILTFKQNLLDNSDWINIIVVSHYTPTVFFILSVMGNGNASRSPFKIDNASLTLIERVQDFEYIRMMNYSP